MMQKYMYEFHFSVDPTLGRRPNAIDTKADAEKLLAPRDRKWVAIRSLSSQNSAKYNKDTCLSGNISHIKVIKLG